jgi:hypothetical protein
MKKLNDFRFSNRRNFLWLAGMSSVAAAFGGLSRKSLAQRPPATVPNPNVQAPGAVTPQNLRLPQNTQILLRNIRLANPSDPAALSRSGQVAPEQLDSAFERLNDAFSFDPASGALARNPAVRLNPDEEQVVQRLLVGYQRQVQAGEVKLRRDANQRFVPLTAEPEVEFRGAVTATPQAKANSQQKALPSSTSFSEFDTNSNSSNADSYLVAQGCPWQWWRKRYWWGYRISFNKTAVNWLSGSAGSAAAILAAMGITGVAAVAIGIAAAVLKAFSNDNGVRIYITWLGAWWLMPKPTPSGGC